MTTAEELRMPVARTCPFAQPEHETFRWDMALTADDLIGMLGTFSWILMMDDATRIGVLAEARRLLAARPRFHQINEL